VLKPISLAGKTQVKIHLVSWLAALAEKAGTRLFARDDLTAIKNGWQVTMHRGGLGRRYRDPRFDTLRTCPGCNGDGLAGGEPCITCRGTGRATRAPSSAGGGEWP
jgi:hypothetical protein